MTGTLREDLRPPTSVREPADIADPESAADSLAAGLETWLERGPLPVLEEFFGGTAGHVAASDAIREVLASRTRLRAENEALRAKLAAAPETAAQISAAAADAQAGEDPLLAYADLALDFCAHTVTRAGREVDLSRTHMRLLEVFLRHPRQVLSRGQLLDWVWGVDGGESNLVAVGVHALRRKLESAGEPRLIHTVRGVGYVLRGPVGGGSS